MSRQCHFGIKGAVPQDTLFCVKEAGHGDGHSVDASLWEPMAQPHHSDTCPACLNPSSSDEESPGA